MKFRLFSPPNKIKTYYTNCKPFKETAYYKDREAFREALINHFKGLKKIGLNYELK